MRIQILDLHFLGTPGLIASFLIESQGEWALIEPGPGSCLPQALKALAELGVKPEAIRKVFVSHVHLDHAGAAGWWAQQGAQLFCHPRAARHLIDPRRLLESARQVYGEQMESLWGPMLPAPEERVTVLADGDGVRIGDETLIAWDTPGHARHHHVFVVNDVCFTGDVAGVRLQNSPYLSVAAAPPQFDLTAYLSSVQRLRDGCFRRLFLTHFGEIIDVESHLEEYRECLIEVSHVVKAAVEEGLSGSEFESYYQAIQFAKAEAEGVGFALWESYEKANSSVMCADGLMQWAQGSE